MPLGRGSAGAQKSPIDAICTIELLYGATNPRLACIAPINDSL